MSQITSRVTAREPAQDTSLHRFAADVRESLTLRPLQLPSRYLYDDLGSALFDAICRLPWYRVTRAELRLLARHARDIFGGLGSLTTIVELGPGNGDKLTTLVEAGRPADVPLELHLIDVSASALAGAARALTSLDGVYIVTHEATYEAGLREATDEGRRSGRTLALFLGSNIGNFDPPGADAFLAGIRAVLTRGDALLIGVDLRKPEGDLLLAYDDPLGITAAFNRNLLVRINRELGADFDVTAFGHRALWNAGHSRVEMHLVSKRPQRVRIPAADLTIDFPAGETIWTESAYKYDPQGVFEVTARAGFAPIGQWTDEEDGFALTLVEAI